MRISPLVLYSKLKKTCLMAEDKNDVMKKLFILNVIKHNNCEHFKTLND